MTRDIRARSRNGALQAPKTAVEKPPFLGFAAPNVSVFGGSAIVGASL
jgi:hypothetical protein